MAEQIRTGEEGIVGVMLESYLHAGRQNMPADGPQGLKIGISITDACIDWETTACVLKGLSVAVKERRRLRKELNGEFHALESGTAPAAK